MPLVRIKPLRQGAAAPGPAAAGTDASHENAQEPSPGVGGSPESDGEGLAGLLGQYGSDSEDDKAA